MAPALEAYFGDRRLVRVLVTRRLALARNNRRIAFIAGVAGKRPRHKPSSVDRYLPPRKHWPRPGRKRRAGDRAVPDLIVDLLVRRVLAHLSTPPSPTEYRWLSRLRTFLETIRRRALSYLGPAPVAPSVIMATPKEKPGSRQPYRVLAVYGLENTLLLSGFAAYLRDVIDPHLSDAALAFRSPSGGAPRSHNAACELIREYAGKTTGKIHCAEIDIQGFFDAIPHETARDSLVRLERRGGFRLDPRFWGFLAAVLDGYEYRGAGRTRARAWLAGRGVRHPKLKDPFGSLERCKMEPRQGDIGIAQGSALSCVLANCVLAAADDAVQAQQAAETKSSLYLRFCDDIIILHPTRAGCTRLLEAYVKPLRSYRLPYHPPVKEAYGAGFWKAKSKKPYLWDDAEVPWLAFVGYHFRRDGTTRVRPSSIKRETDKQHDAVNSILATLDRRRKRVKGRRIRCLPLDEAAYRLQMHLLAIGVGYPRAWQTQPAPNSVSWARGFEGLLGGTVDASGLQLLDKSSRRAVQRFLGRYKSFLKAHGRLKGKPKKTFAKLKKRPFRLKFTGKPFSYWQQFHRPPASAGSGGGKSKSPPGQAGPPPPTNPTQTTGSS